MSLFAYTTYQFSDDTPTITKIKLLAYDRDRYVTITFDGAECLYDVKGAYIFSDPSCSKTIKRRVLFKLPCNVAQPAPTNLQRATEIKLSRKSTIVYDVWCDGMKKQFKNLHDALQYFASRHKQCTNCFVNMHTNNKHFYSGRSIVWLEDGKIVMEPHSRYRMSITRHHYQFLK